MYPRQTKVPKYEKATIYSTSKLVLGGIITDNMRQSSHGNQWSQFCVALDKSLYTW